MSLSLASALGVSCSVLDARAEDPAEETVPVSVDMDVGSVRIVGAGIDASCVSPCVLHVPRGTYNVTTPLTSEKVLLDRATRLSISRGSPALAKASTVMLVAGAAIVLASIIIPLVACRSIDRSIDGYGRVIPASNTCDGVSDGAKVAWIGGAGAGLTMALFGGISLALTGPSLSTRDWRQGGATLAFKF